VLFYTDGVTGGSTSGTRADFLRPDGALRAAPPTAIRHVVDDLELCHGHEPDDVTLVAIGCNGSRAAVIPTALP
jgi:hypothetical protein